MELESDVKVMVSAWNRLPPKKVPYSTKQGSFSLNHFFCALHDVSPHPHICTVLIALSPIQAKARFPPPLFTAAQLRKTDYCLFILFISLFPHVRGRPPRYLRHEKWDICLKVSPAFLRQFRGERKGGYV